MLLRVKRVRVWLGVLVPAIVFHHVCQLNDKLPLLVLLTGFKCMFLEEGREEDHLYNSHVYYTVHSSIQVINEVFTLNHMHGITKCTSCTGSGVS